MIHNVLYKLLNICIYSINRLSVINIFYYLFQVDVGEGAKKRMLDEMTFSSVTSDITDGKANQ